MQIDYDSAEPVYVQIARLIRDQIIRGELPVGTQIPSGNEIQQSKGVTRVTYQHAVDRLRDAGLVATRPGRGTFVVAVPVMQEIDLAPGDRVTARLPAEGERCSIDADLSPILVVTRADGTEETYPASVTMCRVSGMSSAVPQAASDIHDIRHQ